MQQLTVNSDKVTKALTYGLTHLALKVSDIARAIQFYQHVFGVHVMYRNTNFAQVSTPGCNDILVFEKSKSNAIGKSGGIAHFGFRLREPEDIDQIKLRVIEAGGVIKEKGEFVQGEPYIFFFDPDGYEVEVWYERIDEDENEC